MAIDNSYNININNTEVLRDVLAIAPVTVDQKPVSGSTVTLRVVVNTDNMANGSVILKVNGKTLRNADGSIVQVAIVDDVATYEYTLPCVSTNKDITLSAVYSGSKTLRSYTSTITVLAQTVNIQINATGNLKAGNTVTLTATVTDGENSPVINGKVIFKLNGKTLRDADGNVVYATVVDGVASISYTIPDSYSAKDYTLTAVFSGSGYSRSEANATITLTKTDVKVTVSDITINKGDNTQVKASITDGEGNLITGTTRVVVKINSRTAIQTVAADGVVDVDMITSQLAAGTYTITVVAGENSYHNRSESSLTLTVNE